MVQKNPNDVWPQGPAFGFDIFALPNSGRVVLLNMAQLLV